MILGEENCTSVFLRKCKQKFRKLENISCESELPVRVYNEVLQNNFSQTVSIVYMLGYAKIRSNHFLFKQ